jgi:3-hydroxybutyryl-CoA dehydrogenase
MIGRSTRSVETAEARLAKALGRVEEGRREAIELTMDRSEIEGADLVVEAVAEDVDVKSEVLGNAGIVAPEADLATTTSSLGVGVIGEASRTSDSLVGLHVFNPVPDMALVEVCVPEAADPSAGDRIEAWCRSVGKTPIRVPDTPGFVVNRLLFPYLFEAVRLMDRTGLPAGDVDTCMTLGLSHPMGPLALLDLVGLDVAVAIGEALFEETGAPGDRAPGTIVEMVDRGHLGRKSGRGFYEYA